mgnify:CR=1 FL=1
MKIEDKVMLILLYGCFITNTIIIIALFLTYYFYVAIILALVDCVYFYYIREIYIKNKDENIQI